jgi:hypothetical protein
MPGGTEEEHIEDSEIHVGLSGGVSGRKFVRE